jgi:glycine hydroxymethyltransferase
MSLLQEVDPEVAQAIRQETDRQAMTLELIASENFVSEAVLEAQGSVLTNKYAEGLPGKRYYGGCGYVDVVENLAIDRAKALFGADAANVQPHSGAQANMAVYFATLQPGDTYLGMNLTHGGHLTHGSPVNFPGRFYKVIPYGVRESDQRIDYDEVGPGPAHRPKLISRGERSRRRLRAVPRDRRRGGAMVQRTSPTPASVAAVATRCHCEFVTTTTHKTLRGPRGGMILTREAHAKAINSMVFPGIQGGPLMHVIAAKAVAFREAQAPAFREYQAQILKNASALASRLTARGWALVSGGTDTHLLLMDLRKTDLTGKVAEEALDRAGITVNKNTIPFETRSPFVTSGIRIGTPAVTTRGMKENEMAQIGDLIADVLDRPDDAGVIDRVRTAVGELCAAFPLYASRRASS